MSKTSKSENYYLIDGSGYIFRAYYALPPLSRKSDGLPTGAVAGFCNMLFKLLEDAKSLENKSRPTHFAVIFDSARKNFRNEIYSDYKANRSDAPDDLIPQFDYIRKSVEAFNLPSIELTNYEADDLIATYSEQIIKKGENVTVVSSDKDLMQLYKKNLRIYDPMKNKFISEEDIQKKFGVSADKVVDVQSLAGDSSDNVPGVPGIGIKTAAELINKYGSLEKLLLNTKKIKQNKRRETLIENREKAIISKKLVTLKKDVPLEVPFSEFKLKQIDKKKLYNFLRDMEFNRLLSQAISFYGEPGNKDFNEKTQARKNNKINTKNYKTISNEKQLDELIQKLNEKSVIAVDTETSGLNPRKDKIVGWSVSGDEGVGFYLPTLVWNFEKDKLELQTIMGESSEVISKNLIKLLKGKKLVFHNASFDCQFIKNYFGIDLIEDIWVDTGLLVHTVYEEGAFGFGNPFGLKSIAIMLSLIHI